MGRGLGFQCKPEVLIDENKIEKIFRMNTNGQTRKLGDLLTEVPLDEGNGSFRRSKKRSFDWYKKVIESNEEQL